MSSSPDEWMTAIVRHAKALREAGVRRMKLDGCEVELAPPQEPDAKPRPDQDEEHADPLYDGATFGSVNGRVPGFKRPDFE